MVGAHVLSDLVHNRVVRVGPCDESTLAGDLL